ncbi:MAG: hypothetical protein QMC81_04700 [Thermoanaerobacterales bacterium]|nr:hypothetical protein [Bacillota bacterium]MDI6906776.1 hypothetical protein [Thermoanaerobacterales bacterium]
MANGRSRSFLRYVLLVTLASFTVTILLSFFSEFATRRLASIALAIAMLVVIIAINVIADILGTAATAARETPFHAKAAKKVFGAQQGVYLLRNADKVANFANDFIGDIAGTLAGALGISLMVQVSRGLPAADVVTLNVLITALIAGLTVGGKALGKYIAVGHANEVIFLAGRVLAILQRLASWRGGNRNSRNRKGGK